MPELAILHLRRSKHKYLFRRANTSSSRFGSIWIAAQDREQTTFPRSIAHRSKLTLQPNMPLIADSMRLVLHLL